MFETHIKRRRSTTPLLLLGAAVVTVILLLIPWPYAVATSYTLEPMSVQEVAAPRAGRLAEVAVEMGQEVKRGDVLARYDLAASEEAVTRLEEQRAELEQRAQAVGLTAAQARVEEASEADRPRAEAAVERLMRRRGVAELAEQLRVTREELSRAQQEVEAATITAPMDGVVGTLSMKAGDEVTAEQRLAQVEDISRLRAVLAVPSGEPVAAGQTVTLMLSDGRREAQIAEPPENGLTHATIDNPGGELLPGSSGAASIDAGQRSILLGHQQHASR